MENAYGFRRAQLQLGFNRINTLGNSFIFPFLKTKQKTPEMCHPVPVEKCTGFQSCSEGLLLHYRGFS